MRLFFSWTMGQKCIASDIIFPLILNFRCLLFASFIVGSECGYANQCYRQPAVHCGAGDGPSSLPCLNQCLTFVHDSPSFHQAFSSPLFSSSHTYICMLFCRKWRLSSGPCSSCREFTSVAFPLMQRKMPLRR